MEHVVSAADSANDELRLRSLTCVKNLVHMASGDETREILSAIPVARLVVALSDEQLGVQEQALAALRSVAMAGTPFESKATRASLVDAIAGKLASPLSSALLHPCLFVLNNLAFSVREFRDEFVFDGRLIPYVLSALVGLYHAGSH